MPSNRTELPPADFEMMARQAILWLSICGVAAVPSFLWGDVGFSIPAMLLGVVIFAAMFTVISVSTPFRGFLRRPFMRRTFCAAFVLRLITSVTLPIGIAVDVWPGLLATQAVQYGYASLGLETQRPDFFATLLITLLQGIFLNVLVVLLIAALWAPQRCFLVWRPRDRNDCFRCGYPLSENHHESGSRCPECGSDAGPVGDDPAFIDRLPRKWFAILTIGALAAAATIQFTALKWMDAYPL